MAEGTGGEAAAFSFTELTQLAGRVAQHVRARLSPTDAKSTWLGPSAQLADALAGSVLRCSSSEAGSFWMVIPPRVPSVATVRRHRGVVAVRVSRDGASMSAKYEDLQSFHGIVSSIVPGVVTMGGARGAFAHTVKLLASGAGATVSVTAAAPSQHARPLFTVTCAAEVVIGATQDFDEVARLLSVSEIPWVQFAQGEWWGLPPVEVAPVLRPLAWAPTHDALGIITVFGMPSVSSIMDALQFLVGCCEPPPAWLTAEELSQAYADSAPAAEREELLAVMARLSAVTASRPDIVDSVHSRLKAITQSEDAPAPFVAFGRAWRQGALEPPSHQRSSRSASPSSALAHRRATRTSPQRAPTPTLDEELNAMSPGTMRLKLRMLLAGPSGTATTQQTADAADAVAAARQVVPSPSSIARRSPARRAQHSGQLGGLFAGGLAAVDPSLTAEGAALRPAQTVPPASPATRSALPPAPVPAAPGAPSVASVLPTISPDNEGAARATAVVIPMCYRHAPVTEVVRGLVSHGMPDVVEQLAHSAGDTALRAAPGSAFEALSLLRHIEEVFADVINAAPSFNSFLERPVASDWPEAVDAIQALLFKHSSVFRVKRQRGTPAATESVASPVVVEDKPPVGSFKQVSVATATERTGACDAQLLEDMASATALRREHVRTSVFCVPNTSVAARDAALPGELAHFCSTYGQAATAYLLSNGTAQTALSGYGVPMALAAIRLHLLARVTQLIHTTVGFERALLSMHAKCTSLATGFLSGVMELEDCVTILGGSAPHEDAEVRREGGAVSSGTLGATSGDNAQLSIREALAAWGRGLHLVMGEIPGMATDGTDFAVSAQLKKIPRDLALDKLLSVCRYMVWNVGVALSKHRTIRDEPLPDVCAIVHTATTKVFRERELDQRSEERAIAAMGPVISPMLARLQQLEAAQAKGKSPGQAVSTTAAGPKDRKASKSSLRPYGNKPSGSVAEQAQQAPSAQEAAQQFLLSLHTTAPCGAADGANSSAAHASHTPQALVPPLPSSGGAQPAGSGRLTSRQKAIMELSAIYRKHVGMDPKGDPTQEPCSYRALFGKCVQSDCQRCQTGKSFPQSMVDAVKARCLPKLFNDNPSPTSGGPKGGKGAVKSDSK